jgi:hypothetical protein
LDGSRKFGILPEHIPKGGKSHKQSHRQQQLSRDFDRLNVNQEPVKEEAIPKNDEQLVKKAVDQCAILNFEYIQDFNVLKCGENIKTQRQMMIIQIVENKYAIGLFLDPFDGYGVLSPTA